MQTIFKTIAAVILAMVPVAPALADAGHHGHHRSEAKFAAGEPGDPMRPARIVNVAMTESDRKMLFVPSNLEIRRGEQVKFVLRNSGELEHEFVLATTDENLAHAEAMKSGSMKHDDPNARTLDPKKAGHIVWKFTKASAFEYACLIPGHREAGMTGTILVK